MLRHTLRFARPAVGGISAPEILRPEPVHHETLRSATPALPPVGPLAFRRAIGVAIKDQDDLAYLEQRYDELMRGVAA